MSWYGNKVTPHGVDNGLFPRPNKRKSSQGSRICAGMPVRYRPVMRPGATVQGQGVGDHLRGKALAPFSLGKNKSLAAAATAAMGELHPLKPMVAVQQPVPWALIGGGCLLLGAGLAWFWWYRQHRRPPAPAALSAEQQALAALEERGTRLISQPDQYCEHLSAILRQFIEARYRIQAPMMTSREFFQSLGQAGAALPAPLQSRQQELHTVLQALDRVKFAGYRPPREELDQLYNAIVSFIADSGAYIKERQVATK